MPPGKKKMTRKAEVLGMETRGISNGYLQPILSRGTQPLPGTYPGGATSSSTAAYHETANLSPKAIAALRTTRMLQSLGQKVIFSNDPYVNSAFESLITTRVHGVPADLAPDLAELISRKPPGGRLRPKGSKAAALRRAKRLIGAGAALTTAEVPFMDALRVCDLERDRSALPALLRSYVFNKPKLQVAKLEEYCEALARCRPAPMLQSAALLMQAGFYFAAIKVVYGNFEALHATLTEMEGLVAQHMDSGDWDTAAALWKWKDPDRELFLKQFKELRIISYYMEVRKQLRALKDQGVVALARVEREMLLKVVTDFKVQLQEDFDEHMAQVQRDNEERARAKARLEAQARAAAEAAARRAEEAARVEARARAAAEAKAAHEAELRAKAKELDRTREEARKQAEAARSGASSRQTSKKALAVGSTPGEAEGTEAGAEEGASAKPEGEGAEEGAEQAPAEGAETTAGGEAEAEGEPAEGKGEGEEGEAEAKPEGEEGAAEGEEAAAAEGEAAPAEGEEAPAAEGEAPAAEAEGEEAAPADADAAAEGEADAAAAEAEAGDTVGELAGSRPASAAADADAAAAAPSGRPPVRVHLRPNSRGLAVNFSMDRADAAETAAGIAELQKAMDAERKSSEAEAEAIKAAAAAGSRPSTATPAIKLNITLGGGDPAAAEQLKAMEAALEAERAEFQRRLDEERATLATVLAEEKSKLELQVAEQKKMFDEERQRLLQNLYEQQGRELDQQLGAAAQSVESLKAQRDALKSAGGSRHTSGRNAAAAAEEAARLEAACKTLEKKLDDELSRVRQLEEERNRVEAERLALEASQKMLEAQKSQAEVEKAKAEQEKGALQEQIAKTMRMFQEQLAQTVKMAAMLQAQRILGAATGTAGPALAMGPMGPMAAGGMLMAQASGGSISLPPGSAPGLLAPGVGSLSAQGSSGLLGGMPGMGSPSMGSLSGPPGLPAPVAPAEVDEPPTQDEIVAYGKYLGMDVVEDAELLHIAEWALTAPLPEGWTVHLDGEGNEFFYNAATNASTYEHPMDEHYRAYYRKMKEQKALTKMTEAQQAGA